MDVTLPLLTRILMGISHFLYVYRYFLPVAAVMILAGWKILTERVWFRYSYDRVICKFPVIGRQIRIICTARFCENMSSLYSSGLPITSCLKYTEGTTGNMYLDREIRTIMERVSSGILLSEAIRESGGFEKKLAAVIVTGEEAGHLDKMLERIAGSYEHESDLALNKLVNLLEPVMILLIGIFTGILILGIMERCGTCMEVFDKEGVAVRKNRSEGFVMAEVLVTVLFVTVFTSLLFSSGARRYRSALNLPQERKRGWQPRRWCRSLWRICVRRSRQESLKNYRDRRDFRRRRRQCGQRLEMGRKEDRDSHLLLLERRRFRTCAAGGLYCK